MDFWDATKVMFRRWYVTVPLLLLTAAGTAYIATAVKADYVLTSYVQLIPPATVTDQLQDPRIPRNPWEQLGLEALSQAANYATVDQTFLDQLQSSGLSTNFTITSGDPIAAGATFEVIATSREQAIRTTDTVVKRYRDSVLKLQTPYKLRAKDIITAQRLDQGQNLTRPGGKVKRSIIAVFGVGMLLTCAVTIGIDALIRRRRQRRTGPAAPKETGAAAVVDNAARIYNKPLPAPARDFDGETVLIRIGGNGQKAVPTNAAPRTEPGPLADPPADATVVLPMARGPIDDREGNRR